MNRLKLCLFSLLSLEITQPIFASEISVSLSSRGRRLSQFEPLSPTVATISVIAVDIATLLRNNIAPSQITVILDIDETLTTQRNPHNYHETADVHPRGDAIETVKWMMEKEINVVFSSEWGKYGDDKTAGFKDTLSRLAKLGLGDYIEDKIKDKKISLKGEERSYSVLSSGRAVSVKRLPCPQEDPYYYQKAYSAYFFNRQLAQQTKVIFFADDAPHNATIFNVDINKARLKLYPNLKRVQLYTLSEQTQQKNRWPETLKKINKILKGSNSESPARTAASL